MPFVPDWAPNVHPLIVHFPIAILVLAVLVDVIGLAFKNRVFFRRAAVLLYVAGGLAAAAAFLTGQDAGDSVFLPDGANAVLTEHADMALYTLWYYGVYGVIRLLMHVLRFDVRMSFRIPLVLVAAGGLFLVYETAEYGGEMVYRHGVGVEAVDASPSIVLPAADSVSAGPVSNEDGGWSWKPQRAAAWLNSMQLLEGDRSALMPSLVDGGERGDVLGRGVRDQPVMFVYEDTLADVQIDAAINLDDFEGTFMLVHNVQDAENYHFTAISDGEVRQGRSENGDLYLLDEADFSASDWMAIRLVGDDTHFRAYIDEQMIVHGHGDAAAPGLVGIRLNGRGTARLDYMQVTTVR